MIITSKRIRTQKVDRSVTIYHKAKTAKRDYKACQSARLTAGSDRREPIDIENQLIH